jgi:hypothetical protein
MELTLIKNSDDLVSWFFRSAEGSGVGVDAGQVYLKHQQVIAWAK